MTSAKSEDDKVLLLLDYKSKGRLTPGVVAYLERRFTREKFTISPKIMDCFH
jgi:hypothetical protein